MPVTKVKSTWVSGDLYFQNASTGATVCAITDDASGSGFPSLGYAVEGVAAGYKVARCSAACTATTNVSHGLTTCVAFSLQPVFSSAATRNPRICAAIHGKINGTKLALYKYQATGAKAFAAATVAGTISWIAVGT